MRRRRFPAWLAPAAGLILFLSLALACASKPRGPLPTLSDYSDGVSDWSERFLADWRAGCPDGSFYGAGGGFHWDGPLPGEKLDAAASRPPLSIAIFRAPAAAAGSGTAPSHDAVAVRNALAGIRGRFATLGRTEAVLFGFRRKGAAREIVLGILLTGRGASGELRQEGGRIRARLVPSPSAEKTETRWGLESAAVGEWMSASASQPSMRGG